MVECREDEEPSFICFSADWQGMQPLIFIGFINLFSWFVFHHLITSFIDPNSEGLPALVVIRMNESYSLSLSLSVWVDIAYLSRDRRFVTVDIDLVHGLRSKYKRLKLDLISNNQIFFSRKTMEQSPKIFASRNIMYRNTGAYKRGGTIQYTTAYLLSPMSKPYPLSREK